MNLTIIYKLVPIFISILDRDDLDLILDLIEKRIYEAQSEKFRASRAVSIGLIQAVRVILNTPDDDLDQSNPI